MHAGQSKCVQFATDSFGIFLTIAFLPYLRKRRRRPPSTQSAYPLNMFPAIEKKTYIGSPKLKSDYCAPQKFCKCSYR